MKPPGKKETLLAYLERGIAMIHLDARRPGVAVPTAHAEDPHLRINLSYRYGIPDLLVNDERVRATLSFGGRPFQCQIPWSAVFGITSQTNGDGQVWPEDLPVEVMSTLADQEKPQGARRIAKPKRARPALVAVQSDSDAPDDERGTPREADLEAPPPEEATALRVEEPKAPPEKLTAVKREEEDDAEPPPPAGPPKRGHLRLIR